MGAFGSHSYVYMAMANMTVRAVFHTSPPISHASGHVLTHGLRGAVWSFLHPYRPSPEAVSLHRSVGLDLISIEIQA